MNIHQGDIFMADLNPVKGHEQAGFRPVLVMQNDILNEKLNTVIIAPITTNVRAKGYLTTYFLDKIRTKLTFDSVALLYQIRTVDKIRLKRKVGSLGKEQIHTIKQQLSLVF